VSSRRTLTIAALLVCVGIARIALTYTIFGPTYDEPWHVAIGMEWLQWGTYTYETKHPPLARGAVALGPYLAGVRSQVHRDIAQEGVSVIYEDGNAIFESGGNLWRNLALARAGTLPFFVLASAVTFLWARRWFAPAASVWAVALLAAAPPILGHAGLATVDMACAAATLAALYQLLRWIESPDWRRAAWLGAAIALAFLTKLSSLAFLAACLAVALAACARRIPWRAALRHAAIAAAVAFLLMWACYGFTLIPFEAAWGPHPRIDALLADHPGLAPVWSSLASLPLPLTEFITGVRDVSRHNAIGHDSYLLGQYRSTGWWYFFPVVLAVKTPLGFLLLAAVALVSLLHRARRLPWQQVLTALFPLAILAVGMTARIDLGVRHILPIYPLLALVAAHGTAVTIHRRGFRGTALAPVALVAWTFFDSIRAHPDYLAWFNQLAPQPERVLAESDLDWGQDLERLSRRVRDRGIPRLSIAYFGSALMQSSGLPHYEILDPQRPVRGWVAISVHHLYLTHAKDGSYGWLKQYTPVERVGKSIDLFYIE
jgi:hypothetical protein